MSIKIAHVGVAVNSLQEALRFYHEVLRVQEKGITEVERDQVRVAFIGVGESNIELLEPMGPDTNVGKFLAKRGEGIHHLAIRVDNVAEALARAKEHGYQLIDSEPRPGAGGTTVAFIHPKSTSGVLMELVEGEPRH